MSLLLFVLMRLAPGNITDIIFESAGYVDEADRHRLEAELGIDKPLIVQYGRWLGMSIMLTLVRSLGWIPSMTYVPPTENLRANLFQFLLPALAVGYRSSALIMRITRSTMLEVLREDYIRTAWAKGQREALVVW